MISELLAPLGGALLAPAISTVGAGVAGRLVMGSITGLNPSALAVKILGVLAFAALCAFGGWKLANAFAAQEKLEAVNAARVEERRAAKVVTKIETKYVDRIVEIETKGVETRVEVPVYVTEKADRDCPITVGFVELHDAAVQTRSPRRPADPDAPAEGVRLSAVAGTIAKNYTACAVNAETVRGWQEFYTCLKVGGKGCTE